MTSQNKANNEDIGRFDVIQIIKAMWYKKWIFLLSAFTGAILFFAYTMYCITPLYQASVIFYVNNSNISLGSSAISISPSDLTAAKSLVDTYIIILKTQETMDEIIDEAELDYNASQLAGMISAGAINSTEIFKVIVTGSETEEILSIAENIGEVLPDRIAKIVEGSDVRIVNHANITSARVYPSYTTNAAIGFVCGIIICFFYVVIKELSNNTVRSEEYLNQVYDVPILAVVPNLLSQKGAMKYELGKESQKEDISNEV